jgi:hypothetical protein
VRKVEGESKRGSEGKERERESFEFEFEGL